MCSCNCGGYCNKGKNFDDDMRGENSCFPMDWKVKKAYWAGYQNGYRQGCCDAPFCDRNMKRFGEY